MKLLFSYIVKSLKYVHKFLYKWIPAVFVQVSTSRFFVVFILLSLRILPLYPFFCHKEKKARFGTLFFAHFSVNFLHIMIPVCRSDFAQKLNVFYACFNYFQKSIFFTFWFLRTGLARLSFFVQIQILLDIVVFKKKLLLVKPENS